jgi:hypothetical protein
VSYAAADFPSPYTAQAIFEGGSVTQNTTRAMRRRKPDGDDRPSDHDAINWNRIMISFPLFEHDLFGKPVSTFPDQALASNSDRHYQFGLLVPAGSHGT